MTAHFTESVVEDAALARLRSLCATLSPKIIYGEIRVGDAERFILTKVT